MNTIEVSAKTVDKAVESALEQLGVTKEQVTVEVLQEGGLFKQAKVKVTKILNDREKVQQFVSNIVNLMDIGEYQVEVTEDTTQDNTLKVDIKGDGDGSIIGYRGEVLDAIQYLSSLVLSNEKGCYNRIIVDSENYRQKREKILQNLARKLESKVKRSGKPISLEPMNAYERRIIHTVLQNSKYVSTESDGVGTRRHIIVSPKLNNDILNAPQRKTHNFVYRSDKKRR